jgi:glucosylceramidase
MIEGMDAGRASQAGRNGVGAPLRWRQALFAILPILAVGASVVLGGCAAGVPSRGGEAEIWLTTQDRSALLAPQAPVALQPGAPADSVRIDPSRRYQSMVGFGAAISDASAYLIQKKMTAEQRGALLRDLFGRDGGVAFSFTRLTIGASDFSRTHYSYDDLPKGAVDPELRRFSIAPARAEVLPVTRAALAINPDLKIMATPWSPPGWMKTTDSLIKGSLRQELYPAFAAYLRRTVQAFGEEGVPVHYLSIQNEPDFEPDNYPGMRLSPAQRARIIGDHVGPDFARAGLRTELLEWDHNWDKPDQPLAVLADPAAARYVSGVAWHCYGGDVSAQSQVRDRHPEKDVFFTECSGGEWSPAWPEAWPWMMRNLIVGTTRNWARGVLLWNLALDENFGPHLGGCGNCRGVVTIDSRTGEVTRNPEYYALGHLSRFLRPGARRIDSTSPSPDLLTIAFQDGDALVLLAFNAGNAVADFAVASGAAHFRYRLDPRAAATFRWPAAR